METLSLKTAIKLASACGDPRSPARAAEAVAMRYRWRLEIDAHVLTLRPGAREVLEAG